MIYDFNQRRERERELSTNFLVLHLFPCYERVQDKNYALYESHLKFNRK